MKITEIQKILVVEAAIETNIVHLLNEHNDGMLANNIATSLNLDRHVLKELLDVLEILGFITKSGSGVINITSKGKEVLHDRKNTKYRQENNLHSNNMLKNWFHLKEILTGVHYTKEAKEHVYIEKKSGKRRTIKVITTLDSAGILDNVESVLDIGGGPLTYATAFIESKKIDNVTVQDFPHIVQKIKVNKNDLEGIKWFSGDCLEILPEIEHDLTFLANITHIFSASENEQLFKRIADITDRYLVIVDNVKGKTLETSLFSLHIAINTPKGRTYTISEYTSWIERAGFTVDSIVDVQRNRAKMIIAKRN